MGKRKKQIKEQFTTIRNKKLLKIQLNYIKCSKLLRSDFTMPNRCTYNDLPGAKQWIPGLLP